MQQGHRGTPRIRRDTEDYKEPLCKVRPCAGTASRRVGSRTRGLIRCLEAGTQSAPGAADASGPAIFDQDQPRGANLPRRVRHSSWPLSAVAQGHERRGADPAVEARPAPPAPSRSGPLHLPRPARDTCIDDGSIYDQGVYS